MGLVLPIERGLDVGKHCGEDVVFSCWLHKSLLCFAFLSSTSLFAAEFTGGEDPTEQVAYINITGKIEPQDGAKFRKMAEGYIARGNTIHL